MTFKTASTAIGDSSDEYWETTLLLSELHEKKGPNRRNVQA